MAISMQLVLAIVPVVATAAMAPPDADRAGSLRHIDAIEMVWRVDREIDPASGRKSCFVVSLGRDVVVRLSKERQAKTATWSVFVGFDNQPGSIRYLRINRRIFQTAEGNFHDSDANDIVELLKSPGELAFEWGKRPDYAKRQGLFGTGDFAAKAAECERWMNGTPV